MARSVTDICNGALQLVGAASIIDITGNTPEARQCALAYESSRQAELRKHRWAFAIKRVQLAPDATSPLFDYLYQFTVPADCLRILFPSDFALDWTREGNKILTNAGSTLNLRYIADIEDVTKWDSIFYNLMSIVVAQAICMKLTDSPSKATVLAADYRECIREARRNNAFEVLPPEAPDSSFIWVRG